VRIFTPGGELPFAGHPTLGSCHAWLAAGGRAARPAWWCSKCGVGLVRIGAASGQRLAFAAPPAAPQRAAGRRAAARASARAGLAACRGRGPPVGGQRPRLVRGALASAPRCARCSPTGRLGELKLGVVGAQAAGCDTAFEVRAFVPGRGIEDPVTGSLNASLAQWLIGSGQRRRAPTWPRRAHALQRAGRVHRAAEGDTIWVGGDVVACIEGEVNL
jgi:predicted PhzF superfamily epimerase YddE/YHI9